MTRPNPWTDELSQRLAVLWAERATTTAAIAQVFQSEGYRFTKNSIIGRARRLGLPPKAKWPPKAERPATVRSKADGGVIGTAVRDINRSKGKPAYVPIIEDFAARIADIVSLEKPILDLCAMECRWPDDKRNDDGLHTFCGRPTLDKQSYCEAHREINRGQGTASERAASRVSVAA